MRSIRILSVCLLASSFLCAQQGVVRGQIENIPGSNTKFLLDGTNVPLVSSVIRLDSVGRGTFEMKVTNIGSAMAPVLHVDGLASTSTLMDMGNLQLGQASTWEVAAAPGSYAVIAIDFRANTMFTPFDSLGTFLLGPNAVILASGFANVASGLEVRIQTPQDPTLLNMEITAQALVGTPSGRWSFTDPDSKVVQP
jgi:hypothetical protein